MSTICGVCSGTGVVKHCHNWSTGQKEERKCWNCSPVTSKVPELQELHNLLYTAQRQTTLDGYDRAISACHLMLARIRDAMQGVSPTHVIVPRIPTDAMAVAATKEALKHQPQTRPLNGTDVWPAMIAAAQETKPAMQYYYKKDGCSAKDTNDPACICWHDEGTGPFANTPEKVKSWRIKPEKLAQQPAPSAAETAADILERIAEEPPINGNNLATARVLMAAQALRYKPPTPQADSQPATLAAVASKAVLAAIRAANMQLVQTGDDEFMLVKYKNAEAQCDGGKCGIGGYCEQCPAARAPADSVTAQSSGLVVGYRVSDPHEPDLGHWLSEEPGAAWCVSEPLALATPPTQAADSVLEDAARLERERICAAIKAEDDYCVDQGDYMLDSDDCIKIVRGEWVRPDFAIDAAHKQGANHD